MWGVAGVVAGMGMVGAMFALGAFGGADTAGGPPKAAVVQASAPAVTNAQATSVATERLGSSMREGTRLTAKNEERPNAAARLAALTAQGNSAAADDLAALQAEAEAAKAAARRVESLLSSTQSEIMALRALVQREQLSPNPVAATAPEGQALVEVRECVEELRGMAPSLVVFFGSGSAALSDRGELNVRLFGAALQECPGVKVHVTGHSDAQGDDLVNLNLSWQRADNVVAALSGLGVDTTYVDAVGFGARVPYAQGDADEERDRRVEFHVLSDG